MSSLSGLLSALWLLGLFAAAPALRTDARYSFVDRLRDALILGIAIPFALGFVHALYPIACWLVLVGCIVLSYRRPLSKIPITATRTPYILIAALALIAWPQLTRPLLDGDSLSYHLPNAASWVQAHSLWTTTTRYWWYPPASELFAAGIYATSGPFALPWSGIGALALLGFRIAAWARDEFAASPFLADALAAATVTAYPLAIQGGTLENDVWLAAFWLEALWSVHRRQGAALRVSAITTLIKPQGWLLAAIALLTCRAPRSVWLTASGAFMLWLLHDALLWRDAAFPPASTAYTNTFGTTILAHGVPALGLLVRVAFRASPFLLAALVAALLGPLVAARRGLGWAALVVLALFLLLPFGYSTDFAQLATGASLRFAAPAVVSGALIIAQFAGRVPIVATVLLFASTLFGAWSVLRIFWNDISTHIALPVTALIAMIEGTARSARTAWLRALVFGVATWFVLAIIWNDSLIVAVATAAVIVVATMIVGARSCWLNSLVFGIVVIASVHLAELKPLDYYADTLRFDGRSTGVYNWIARARPAAIGGLGLRLGIVNVVSPVTRTLDLPDYSPCAEAKKYDALIVAIAGNDVPPRLNAARLSSARACGRVLYDDSRAVVSSPGETPHS